MTRINQWLLWALGITMLLGYFAVLCYTKNGEILNTVAGEVQHCQILNQGRKQPVTHATIKSSQGDYLIAPLLDCKTGARVTVSIKRGALYFNRVFKTTGEQP